MAQKPLRVAVIGVGNMGKNHVKNYDAIDAATLVAVSDTNVDLGHSVASQYECKYYQNHIEMLEAERLDAVSIVVPSRFHHRVGLDVLAKGVNVLMEKPLAMTKQEAQDLIEMAAVNKLKLMVGFVERFNPGITKLKEMIDGGMLGHVVSIVAKRVFTMPNQIRDANVLVDLAVHDIDLISFLVGSYPDRVVANGGRAHLDDRDDHAEILLSYKGVSGFIETNWVTPVRIRKMEITGTGGYAELDLLTKRLVYYKATVTRSVDDYQDLLVKFAEPETEVIPVVERQPLEVELESFLNSVANGTPVMTTGAEGLKALEIALAAGADIDGHS
jgi:UDP-N-acetylglucosamine 3-dehydrogenase